MSVEYLLWELGKWEDDQDCGGADGQVDVRQNQARPFQEEQDLHSIPGPRFLYRVVKGIVRYLKVVRSIINLEKATTPYQSTAHFTKRRFSQKKKTEGT